MLSSPPSRSALSLLPFLLACGLLAAGCACGTPAGTSSAPDGAAAPGAADEIETRWARQAAGRLPMLEPCRPDGASEELLCGKLAVWEDRERQAGRKIELEVVVVPSRAARPATDAVAFFAGGPGGSVTAQAAGVPQFAAGILEHRDVLLVDQRGTGGSHLLQCDYGVDRAVPQTAFNGMFPLDRVGPCRRELEKIADLSLYTTPIAMDDIEEVRRWLGYEKLTLVGGSYGTRAAQVFMRRHPGSVRAAILQGVVGMNHRLPLYHAADGDRSFRMLFAACAADAACAEAYPRLEERFRALLARLDQEPGRATIEHPETGAPTPLEVDRGLFVEALRSHLYSPHSAAEVPFLIDRADQGDLAPFFRATLPWRQMIELSLAHGMYLSVTCAEDTPFYTDEEAAEANRGTALGDYRSAAQSAACREWVRAPIPEGFHQPLESDAPVLMLLGDLDPVTPPYWGEQAAEHLPNATVVVIPNGHHGFSGLSNQECVDDLTERFIEQGHARGLDTSCVETMARPPFVLAEAEMGYAEQDEG